MGTHHSSTSIQTRASLRAGFLSLSHERVDPAPSGVGDSVDNCVVAQKNRGLPLRLLYPTIVARCVRKRFSIIARLY